MDQRTYVFGDPQKMPAPAAPEPWEDQVETPGELPLAPQALLVYLELHRSELIDQWVLRAARLGPNYRRRSTAELASTISQSYNANSDAMRTGSTAPLDRFLDYITRLRLEAGFPLSEVQKAFDLYRSLITPMLFEHPDLTASGQQAIKAINACVSYQIHRFSDKFQAMHEMALRHHSEDLEREVAVRSAELKASEQRYKTLVEEISDGYFAISEDRIALANRAFCRMHAAPPEKVLSQPMLKFVAPQDKERVRKVYQGTLKGEHGPRALEFTRLGLDGSTGATEIRARVVDLGEGPLLIGICRDVSERRAMEEKIRENERMAYVGQLAASLGHEIRNPLSTIKLNLQILARRLPMLASDRERMEMAVDEVSRLEGILHQLLDLAKPITPRPAPVEVNAVVEGCLDLLSAQMMERGVHVIRELDDRLGRLMLDKAMLEQALINLLLNAMDAVPVGGRIVVRTAPRPADNGPGCLVSVEDNGKGISGEELQEVFTPFFTNKPHGTGLGLTNVKRMAEVHGGGVTVESRPGEGATLTLELACLV